MNRNDQKLLSNLYLENINQFGAKSASSEEMAGMLAKNPAAGQSMETSYSLNAPEGYEVDYDGSTLTVKRTINGLESTTMTKMGKKPIEEVQRDVDYQVAYDEFMSKRGGGASPQQAADAKSAFLAKQKQIYSKK